MKQIIILIIIAMNAATIKAQSDYILEYKKGACMGYCPVYQLKVDENGVMNYNGVAHVDRKGKWTKQLSKREFRILKRKIRWAKIHKLEDKYDENVMDASQTTIHYKYKDTDKTCSWKIETPKSLAKSEQYILKLMDEDFTKQKWEDANEAALIQPGRKENTNQTIIVQFKKDIDIDQWVNKYPKYKLSRVRQIVPNKALYLFSYDQKSIKIQDLVKLLQKDPSCEHVEINKPVKQRR